MSDSALKLSHIFGEAGAAFGKLSELTRQLQYMNDSHSSCKWNEEEVEMLRACVHRFAIDLHQLSLHIKNKTIEQIKRTLRKKAFEDAGIPLREATGPSALSLVGPSPVSPDSPSTGTEPDEFSSDTETSPGSADVDEEEASS